jgi:hypothetical protein
MRPCSQSFFLPKSHFHLIIKGKFCRFEGVCYALALSKNKRLFVSILCTCLSIRLKPITLILLTCLVVSSISKDTLTFLSFKLNRDYIAKNLCEKKDEANNSCCGSCYLKKKLTENHNKDVKGPIPPSKNKTEPLFDKFNRVHIDQAKFIARQAKKLIFNDPTPSLLFSSRIFHPPKI